jgi:hypothetical protein
MEVYRSRVDTRHRFFRFFRFFGFFHGDLGRTRFCGNTATQRVKDFRDGESVGLNLDGAWGMKGSVGSICEINEKYGTNSNCFRNIRMGNVCAFVSRIMFNCFNVSAILLDGGIRINDPVFTAWSFSSTTASFSIRRGRTSSEKDALMVLPLNPRHFLRL